MRIAIEDIASGKITDAEGKRCPDDVVEKLKSAGVDSLAHRGPINWQTIDERAEVLLSYRRSREPAQ